MATGCFDDFRKQCRGMLEWYSIIVLIFDVLNFLKPKYVRVQTILRLLFFELRD